MPSAETAMLADFLLGPASLRSVMTPSQFTDIFPKAHRTNPAVQDVYRELQRLREQDMDQVRRHIAEEVKRSKGLRREYARERWNMDAAAFAGMDPVALQMEQELSWEGRKPHTRATVQRSMEKACEALEAEIAEMEDENARALSDVQEAIGALSDLRHGRFAQSSSGEDMSEEVLASLKRLEEMCSKSQG